MRSVFRARVCPKMYTLAFSMVYHSFGFGTAFAISYKC